jgi:cysteine desulfuration protein SufE
LHEEPGAITGALSRLAIAGCGSHVRVVTAKNLGAALLELEDEFALLPDWEERFRYVIELARELAPLSEAEHAEVNKVRGCASQVWLVSERAAEDASLLRFRGDSDALLVKGLIAILLRLYNDARPADILAFDIQDALARLELGQALSPQRSNGLASMIERIRKEAAAAA